MLADDTREKAIARMIRALEEFEIQGVKTTIPFQLEDTQEPILAKKVKSIPILSKPEYLISLTYLMTPPIKMC